MKQKTLKIKVPKIKVNCDSCGGTGLYRGMAEGGKSAVVCHSCNGQGWMMAREAGKEYRVFTERRHMPNCKRVYLGCFGYGITDEDFTDEKGRTVHFSQYGASYKDWKKGVKPTHIKELYCPYIAYNRGMGNEPLGKKCEEGCNGVHCLGRSITECKHYKDMLKCWEEFEAKGGKS